MISYLLYLSQASSDMNSEKDLASRAMDWGNQAAEQLDFLKARYLQNAT